MSCFSCIYLFIELVDLFVEGSAGGFAIGQAPFATRLKDGDTPHDGNYFAELWYKFQATDNIVVTPGLFYLSRPASGLMDTDETLNQFFVVVFFFSFRLIDR